MAEYVMRVGGFSAQGRRTNNEDRFVVDLDRHVFLVADGMGGQESGEKASGLAAEIIPRVVHDRIQAHQSTGDAVQGALEEANKAILDASQTQAPGRRMGTTAVLAVEHAGQVYVAGVGDSRAYLVRRGRVELLTIDHTVAEALVRNGTLTAEEARQSRWRNVLYRFLGCAEMNEGADVRPFTPQDGDRLVLASDGLTNHIGEEDFLTGSSRHPDPQEWAEYLVQTALERGSSDNVTCLVISFDPESTQSKA